MLVIGLTGGIASGKSTVSSFLRQLGAVIIDADVIAREQVAPDSPGWLEIRRCFGEEYFNGDGLLNRKKLGELVFNSPAAREKLNSILHPKIIQAVRERIKTYQEAAEVQLIVVDAPLLIETGMSDLADEVWVVSIDRSEQINRLMQRDRLSQAEAESRLLMQMPLEEKLLYADRVIDNSREPTDVLAQVREIWQKVAGHQ